MPEPGEGRIHCQVLMGRIQQATSCAYPLKIISPSAAHTTDENGVKRALVPAVSYLMSYGGGIVHGDQIFVDVKVSSRAALLLLTQGSTKVFRERGSRPPSYLENSRTGYDPEQSYQTLEMAVADNALLCVLPDPVTCFSGALYNQRQRVRMDPGASLVLLDWMTSGRMSRGEQWAFLKYLSINAITVTEDSRGKERLIVRDALLLEGEMVAEKLAGIGVFAYLLVLGPAVASIAQVFRSEHHKTRIRPFSRTRAEPATVEWSVSEVSEHGITGIAVRAAGPSTDDVKDWIKQRLSPLEYVVGDSAWSMYYNA
ncbi:hypothetical protein GGF46_004649 [Coemansia sp. RSA 552]|nr:hypothetical protein GGF46_004649 [Coemansia sp. RSA 552]